MPAIKHTWAVFLGIALLTGACSVPNLEPAPCRASREPIKKFYSFYFGSHGQDADGSGAVMRSFLTDRLNGELTQNPDSGTDYFTRTSDFPTAFRIGSCESDSEQEARFQVVLLWRDDNVSEQREVRASVVKAGDKWLIDRVAE
jgi:hypothetical protein